MLALAVVMGVTAAMSAMSVVAAGGFALGVDTAHVSHWVAAPKLRAWGPLRLKLPVRQPRPLVPTAWHRPQVHPLPLPVPDQHYHHHHHHVAITPVVPTPSLVPAAPLSPIPPLISPPPIVPTPQVVPAVTLTPAPTLVTPHPLAPLPSFVPKPPIVTNPLFHPPAAPVLSSSSITPWQTGWRPLVVSGPLPLLLRPGGSVHTSLFATFPRHPLLITLPRRLPIVPPHQPHPSHHLPTTPSYHPPTTSSHALIPLPTPVGATAPASHLVTQYPQLAGWQPSPSPLHHYKTDNHIQVYEHTDERKNADYTHNSDEQQQYNHLLHQQQLTNEFEAQQQLSQEYAAPNQHFRQEYEAPQQQISENYGAPHQQFSQEYAASQQQISENYGTPHQQFSQEYAVPQQQISENYGTPHQQLSQEYAMSQQQINENYGPPHQPLNQEYGAPQQQLSEDYGTHHQQLNEEYKVPHQHLSQEYGVPQQQLPLEYRSTQRRDTLETVASDGDDQQRQRAGSR